MVLGIASRLAQMVFVLWLVVSAVFVLIHLAPGDATAHLGLDPQLPGVARQLQAERLGLDRPLHVQYVAYLTGVASGDLGLSSSLYPREVGEIIAQRLPRTLALLLGATLAAFGLGLVVGRWLAFRRGGVIEHASVMAAVFLYTAFPPWVALMMIWLFSFELGWFPSGRLVTPHVWRDSPWAANDVVVVLLASLTVLLVLMVLSLVAVRRLDQPRARQVVGVVTVVTAVVLFAIYWARQPMRLFAADILWHTALPTLTIMLLAFGATALLARASMLDTLEEDFVRTARAKGLSERVVRNRHVARTALNPILVSLTLSLAGVVSGSIVFEAVFSWPGLGLTFLDAVIARDVPLATGVLLAYGAVLLVLNAALEVAQRLLDPRLRPMSASTT